MKFEKEFPSLKDKLVKQHKLSDWILTNDEDNSFIETLLVKRHCLDKQKVKEAIMKHCKAKTYATITNWDIDNPFEQIKKELLKELGLEE